MGRKKIIGDVKSLIEMYKQLFYILDRGQKVEAIYVFILIIIGALLETLGVSAIMPFINAIISPETERSKWYVRLIQNVIDIESDRNLLLYTVVLVIGVYLIKNIYLIISGYCQVTFKYKCQRELSVKMMDYFLKRPYSYFLNVNSSQILRSINDDINGVFGVIENTFFFLVEFLPIALITAYLFSLDWMIASGLILLAIGCVLLITYTFKRQLTELGEKIRVADSKQYNSILEVANGIKDIFVLKKEQYFTQKYATIYAQKTQINIQQGIVMSLPSKMIEFVCVTGLMLLIWIRINTSNDIEVYMSILATVAVAAFRILTSVSKLPGYINGLIFYRPTLMAAYENMKEVENNCIERQSLNPKKGINYAFRSSIALNNICWSYDSDKTNVINELSLVINKGEAVAFIGHSGAGKTTLADVILNILIPQKGEILVDGVNINEVAWEQMVGYVPQSIYFADDTIRNNIAFGVDESNIDEEQIWRALKEAQLFEVVNELPNKLGTVIGERGIRFSGGQRQRLAIARALYFNPEIIILDEATSALDNETEEAVMGAIDALHGQKTLIIIAHRLSTIRSCDRIIEIAEGKAIERKKDEVLQMNR